MASLREVALATQKQLATPTSPSTSWTAPRARRQSAKRPGKTQHPVDEDHDEGMAGYQPDNHGGLGGLAMQAVSVIKADVKKDFKEEDLKENVKDEDIKQAFERNFNNDVKEEGNREKQATAPALRSGLAPVAAAAPLAAKMHPLFDTKLAKTIHEAAKKRKSAGQITSFFKKLPK
eukprot:CAMPEP_0119115354 /NCGR_PEP_ID=MMETSP1180-20130426/50689_1 /TAXON_ID=3052 ORGANISM="Chlamydomonas cf sp, Strain CCMP681" /NCGR_SAMPLE_ID=MMETSP1180 /ASSEMBLY_ACC=CAM_ASM_000741 /LENGTH=175 /DNA_ID=CAMNT_0007104291 /DNA_START=8 /DNA_END=535 /DNA_ORIENTATION=+